MTTRKAPRFSTWLVSALALGALLAAGCGAQRPRTNLPDLTLQRLDGGEWNLHDEAGTVVLLQFFATFDGSSIALATALERIHIAYAQRGVTVVGVAMDPPSTRRRSQIVETFCAVNNLTFDVVLASEELGQGETEVGRIPTIPATVIFDRDGDPIASAQGRFDQDELEGLLDALLERRPHPLLPAGGQ